MTAPGVQAAETERHVRLPAGAGERFTGYGVMGLPFASGQVLAMRRFPASSIGPAHTSVWHRDPAGRWDFWQKPARRPGRLPLLRLGAGRDAPGAYRTGLAR
jgi:hypothetical protein